MIAKAGNGYNFHNHIIKHLLFLDQQSHFLIVILYFDLWHCQSLTSTKQMAESVQTQ